MQALTFLPWWFVGTCLWGWGQAAPRAGGHSAPSSPGPLPATGREEDCLSRASGQCHEPRLSAMRAAPESLCMKAKRFCETAFQPYRNGFSARLAVHPLDGGWMRRQHGRIEAAPGSPSFVRPARQGRGVTAPAGPEELISPARSPLSSLRLADRPVLPCRVRRRPVAGLGVVRQLGA